MSKLEELINELCPNGVEYKPLGAIAKFRRGSFPQPYGNEEWYDGEGAMPFVQVVDVGEDMRLVQNTKNKISKLAQPKSVFVHAGTVIVTLQGSIGRVAITQYDCYVDRTLAIFESFQTKINKKYFAYQLKVKFEFEKENARGSTIKTITKEEFTKFQIPIPPLKVQEEIVSILDTFTELTAKLAAELTAELIDRKKQYEYYRDGLLTFGDEIPILSLNEVAQYSGDRINATDVDENNYVGVDNLLQNKKGKTISTHVPTEGRLTKYKKENILIGNIRPYLKKIWFSDNTGGTNGDVLVIQTTTDSLLPKYLYTILCGDKFFDYNMQNAKGAKMPRGNKDAIMRYPVPIPQLEEQQRIVDILDRFDTLCNDISNGLPAEIKARQQQYEYYRDKLLTFPNVKKEV